MLSYIVIQLILFLYFNILIIHYTCFPIPVLFNSLSLLSSNETNQHYLYNSFLYSLFFIQHIGMALLSFKIKLLNIWNKYPLY